MENPIFRTVARHVHRVGGFQLERFRKSGNGREKSRKQYVSEIDIRSEEMLKRSLTRILPAASFYGEETAKSRTAGEIWVVDPLDGTTNYLSGFDEWSISVALVRETTPVLGYVYKPSTGESFAATSDRAVYTDSNGTIHPLRRLPEFSLEHALVATGFPYRSPDTMKQFFACTEEVLHHSRGIRRTGSAALDLCRAAAGFFQGFWEVDLEPYDVAAAIAVLNATGCPVTDFAGRPYRLFESRTIVAGPPGAQRELQRITESSYARLIS